MKTKEAIAMEAPEPVRKFAPSEISEVPPTTPMAILAMAVSRNMDADKLEKLMALQERWEANQARNAFYEALTAFKADPPKIFKTKEVSYGVGKASFNHATLFDASNAVATSLAKHGLSHRWRTSQGEGGLVEVTCVISHRLGHSEETKLRAAPDSSGSKNAVQAVGSTVSYLQRYTLLAATGMAASDVDDDGQSSESVFLSPEQIEELNCAILDAAKRGYAEAGAMKWLKERHKIESIDQIMASDLSETLKAMKAWPNKSKA